jgi:hypothetical protein
MLYNVIDKLENHVEQTVILYRSHFLKGTDTKKVFQINIWGNALNLQYEPPTYLKFV